MEIIFPQNIFFYISAILTLVLFFVLLIAFFSGKKKNRIKKSLDSSLFLIRLPKYEKIKEGEKIDQKILIGKMEQIFANFLYLEDKSFSSVFFGNRPTAAMEVASEFGGSDISFYIAVPNYYALALPKYIQGAYPGAIVEKIANDYTIFEPEAIAATAYLRLKSSFYLPLKTYNDLDTDPLEAIANSLTNIKEDEGAAIQIIIRPPKTDYKKIGDEIIRHIINNGKDLLTAISESNKGLLSGLVSSPTPKKNELGENQLKERRVDDATIEALRAKLKKPFFETNIRLVASAKNQNRANEILQNLESSFSQFFSSFNNLQVVRLKGNNARRLTYKYIFREFEERERLVLNSEELSSLYHLPLPHIESPYIKWAGTKEVEPSINLPISGPILLGKTMFRGEEKNVYIASEEDRRRHFYIVGQTGVGKSGFLSEMIRQDIESGHGVGVIDPHGELVEDILTLVPEERVGDVVLFEPFQTERPCGLNMLEWETPEQKDLAVSEMVAIFYKLFPPEMIGPMFEHYMRNAMLAIMADKDNPGTLIEIPRIFTDDKFMEAKLQKVSDPLVRSFWLKEWKQTTGSTKSDMLGYVISKIGRFIENEMLRNIVGQPRSGFNLSEIMDNKKIFLANLSKGQTGELNSSLLGLILVSKMQMAAMKRASMPSELRKDFYLYLDEFQNFATDSIATILSEARKYRLDLILAHQYMPQLTDTIKNAVIGNVGTFASFRIGADDAEFLEKQFSPQFSKFDLLNLDNFQLILKMMINNKLATPFKIKTLLPQKGNPEISLAIKELSKIRYGRPKSMVEADIMTTLNL